MSQSKRHFYIRDRMARQTEFMGFRCYEALSKTLKEIAATEKSDTSALIRRLLCKALADEGVDVASLLKQ
jgi:hypothetical protein